MKIGKVNCCVKSILSIFHDFKSDIVVFQHIKLDSTAEN